MTTRGVWRDGASVPWDEARVSVLSHAIQRGSLVFDVGAMREAGARAADGREGGVLAFRPREHIARFLRSAALVGLDVPWSEAALLDATLETARASGAASALIRWSAFVPTLEGDVVPRAGRKASVVIAVIMPEDAAFPGEAPLAKPAAVRVAIARGFRKAGPEVFPPQAKVGASYLGPMLAKRQAMDEGYDEVVLLDREGLVAEAPTANVFAVRRGVLVTPPTDRVLAGITRASILEIAKAEGIPAREVPLTSEEFASSDEAFLAGTSLPVQAIAAIDGRPLGDAATGGPGPLTARVKSLLMACERGEDPRFSGWVERVR
jgi:branched-chain amino acid aminotransferase